MRLSSINKERFSFSSIYRLLCQEFEVIFQLEEFEVIFNVIKLYKLHVPDGIKLNHLKNTLLILGQVACLSGGRLIVIRRLTQPS